MNKDQKEIAYVTEYVMELIRKLRESEEDDVLELVKLVTLFVRLKALEQGENEEQHLAELRAEDVAILRRYVE